MVTIKDIAKEANVSSGTVSNVLNRKGNVTEEKIRRVEEAVQRLGYEVNESAKILRKQRSRSIIQKNTITARSRSPQEDGIQMKTPTSTS